MKTYLILLMIPLLAACRGRAVEENAALPPDRENIVVLNDEQLELAGITSGRLEERVLSDILSCNGFVRVPPRGQVTVSLPLEAYVSEIRFHWGERIEKGEVLAVMEHPEFLRLQQDYLETSNNLVMLEEDLQRQEALAREKAASEKTLTAARTQYENTLVRHNSLGEQLRLVGIDPQGLNAENLRSRVHVPSPVTGYVTHHNIKIGELMHPGDPIADMVDISRLNLHLVVYEKDIHRVREGQPVEFTTETGEKTYKGIVHTKGKSIDPGNRSVDVHAHISDPDEHLIPGMYVKAYVLAGESRVYAIPESGVVIQEGQAYLFTREGNAFRRVAVETGLSKDGFVEIISPESLPEREVALSGAYYLNAELGGDE